MFLTKFAFSLIFFISCVLINCNCKSCDDQGALSGRSPSITCKYEDFTLVTSTGDSYGLIFNKTFSTFEEAMENCLQVKISAERENYTIKRTFIEYKCRGNNFGALDATDALRK
ncbi:uncharacterized protein LOC122509230 [Leptopilina heterotoma]|uniref:uncharacterized protein LOC122509230 n=1 Tax=Leptopilina heterotoma TaxID=63436 RepID=UPI001CA8F2A5|nr:uncharacterized protein LOC122509230 [Leptopilina heterotoma]